MSHPTGPAHAAAILPSFRRILLVTDFSSCSEVAAPFARLLAELYQTDLLVAHVIRSEGGEGPADSAHADACNALDAAGEHMRKFLADNSLETATALIKQGPTSDVLEKLIRENDVDLLVVGTHGRSGVGKLLLGSVAQRIFSIAPCPTLSVSPKAQRLSGAGKKAGRILYAADLSAPSPKALAYALSLAKVNDAELCLLHALSEPESSSVSQRLHEELRDLVPPEAAAWCRFDTLVFPGNAAEVILKAASMHNADFVVIGAHLQSGPFYRVNVPLSTAYQVVADAPCPVLRVRM